MKVLVYGTLKQGYGNNRRLRDATYIEDVTVHGFSLYYSGGNGGFPVARPASDDCIVAELWDIGDPETSGIAQETLRGLDALEGEGVMYIRTYIPEHDAFMYVGPESFWEHTFNNDNLCPVIDGQYVWERN